MPERIERADAQDEPAARLPEPARDDLRQRIERLADGHPSSDHYRDADLSRRDGRRDTFRTDTDRKEATGAGASREEATGAGASRGEATDAGASREEATDAGASREEATGARASREEATDARASCEEATDARASREEATGAGTSREEAIRAGTSREMTTAARLDDSRDTTERAGSGWYAPDVRDHPDRPAEDDIRLPGDRERHILDGDGPGQPGGGHRHGTSKPGKTEFPERWTDEAIPQIVEDVARQPDSAERQRTGSWLVTGERDGVRVTSVVLADGTIWTAWPEPGGAGVRQNPKEGAA